MKGARVAFGLVALAAPCWAASGVEHWLATSTTATAITGDVTLRADRITFANGRSLPIERVRNADFTDDAGRTVPASLYRVTQPGDPVLRNGNRICGAPVTFLAIWHVPPLSPGGRDGRELAAYSGPVEPSPSVKGSCGTFFYEIGL